LWLFNLIEQRRLCGAGSIAGSILVIGAVRAGANGQTLSVTGDYTSQGGQTMIGSGIGSKGQTLGNLDVGGVYTATEAFNWMIAGTLTGTEGIWIIGGTFDADGTIQGNLVNAGVLNVGGPEGIGTLTVDGDYTQTGTLNVQLSANSSDQLNIAGTATLGGSLNVTLWGAVSSSGYSATVVTYGQRNGAFDGVSVPPGFSWEYDADGLMVWGGGSGAGDPGGGGGS
jgi:hypothetical protein